jgi:hypothetical protein
MKKKQDSIEHKKYLDAVNAENLIRTWIEAELKDYQEPIRKGTAKGDSIGFSLSKQKAVRWMLFYRPFKLDFIAKCAKVSPGVLRVWKTEEPFQKEIKATAKRLVAAIANTIEYQIKRRYYPETPEPTDGNRFKIYREKKELDEIEAVGTILDEIHFLNGDLVRYPILKWLKIKMENSSELERESYFLLTHRMLKNIHVANEKQYREYIKRPDVIQLHKYLIKKNIDFYVSQQALKHKSLEKIREYLKKDIFQILDLYIF